MSRASSEIRARLDQARRDILDLTLRNPLLNYRPLRAKGLEVVNEDPSRVFDLLVRQRRTAYFLPSRDKESSASDQLSLTMGEARAETAGDVGLADQAEEERRPRVSSSLQTTLSSAELQSRLLMTYRDARASIEERGINTLYLALGMLEWCESETDQEVRRAPLILIPVALERSSVRERFKLTWNGEDLEENASLAERLKDFHIKLPPLPDEDELDVVKYFDRVSRAIRGQRSWRVDRKTIVLSFFFFSQLLIYKDLDCDRWPKDFPLEEQPLLAAVLGDDGFQQQEISISEDDYLDDAVPADELPTVVVDADSSQMHALLRARTGQSLVIHGPPGTGKSQTITNLIADAIHRGKKVLFVSEKMAALEVVKRRLDEVGLGDACLELHSYKANKKAVLDELQRTLGLNGTVSQRSVESTESNPAEARDKLEAYFKALCMPVGESGLTPYEIFGYLAKISEDGSNSQRMELLPLAGVASWSASECGRKRDLVEELGEALKTLGNPSQHPFWGVGLTSCLLTEEQQIREATRDAFDMLTELRESDCALARLLGVLSSESVLDTRKLLQSAELVLEAPDLSGIQLEGGEWTSQRTKLLALADSGEAAADLHSRYDSQLKAEAWTADVSETADTFFRLGRKWSRHFSPKYRAAQRAVASFFRGQAPRDFESIASVLQAINFVQSHEEMLRPHAQRLARVFGDKWRDGKPDWNHLRACVNFLARAEERMSAGEVCDNFWELLRRQTDRVALSRACQRVRDCLDGWDRTIANLLSLLRFDVGSASAPDGISMNYDSAAHRLTEWSNEAHRLQEIVRFNRLLEECDKEGMPELRNLVPSWSRAPEQLLSAFDATWWWCLADRALREREVLANFDPQRYDRLLARFRRLDEEEINSSRRRVASFHRSTMPRPLACGQLGVLLNEFNKRTRHLPIRKLISKAGTAIQAIKPVFMMSPLSVATYLPPGALSFDMVVFDEASQVKPVEAFGALARANQAIVVGDDKQLPPTSFFEVVMEQHDSDDTDESDNAFTSGDKESILSLFKAKGAPETMLRWHYRSKHESLICISNREFYENRLIIFPSPFVNGHEDAADLGLVLEHVPQGIYDRGRSRRNEEEARVVAQAVMRHAREQMAKPEADWLTLGVVAFSVAQAEAIADHVERLRREDDSCEKYFDPGRREPFFVKNLENVQGDERDVIFISVGYGKSADGTVTMNFGPVNAEGGERRLNVLITRARRRCVVFTNLTADDIDLSRSRGRGVQVLKSFLAYAQHRRLSSVPFVSNREDNSPFEDAVYEALLALGYEVDRQVGVGGYYIDLAIKDRERPGRYLLGIECDGASYHSARSARDRDRLRQSVLESLGWRIHRIWSTSWFRNKREELERLQRAIEAAKGGDGAGSSEEADGSAGTCREPGSEHGEQDDCDKQARSGHEHGHSPDHTGPGDVVNYVLSSPEVPRKRGLSLGDVPQTVLLGLIRDVVQVESPVHVEDVYRRVADAYGVARVGSRIRDALDMAVLLGVQKGVVVRKGDFLWWPGQQDVIPRDRSNLPRGFLNLERIAPEEIAAAIRWVVSRSFGIDREEIPGAACRLLGFSRCSEGMRAQVERVLELEIQAGRLRVRSGQVGATVGS